MKTISLEQLAEKLNGKLWVKGDLKRIYLDEGYNTKKMSTKTYVYQTEHGTFGVSCYIECPSQPYQWIKSQQNEVIESVEKRIENIIKLLNVELVEYKIIEEKAECKVFVKANAEAEPSWFTEEAFYEEFGSYPAEAFGGNLEEELEAIYEKRREANRIESEKKESEKQAKSVTQVENTDTPEFGVHSKVQHSNFGIGTVISESNEKIIIDFPSVGEKSLIKRFAKLTFVNE